MKFKAINQTTKQSEYIIEAFQAYKNKKESVIKEMADKYKEKIPLKLYKAMYEYEVEFDD